MKGVVQILSAVSMFVYFTTTSVLAMNQEVLREESSSTTSYKINDHLNHLGNWGDTDDSIDFHTLLVETMNLQQKANCQEEEFVFDYRPKPNSVPILASSPAPAPVVSPAPALAPALVPASVAAPASASASASMDTRNTASLGQTKETQPVQRIFPDPLALVPHQWGIVARPSASASASLAHQVREIHQAGKGSQKLRKSRFSEALAREFAEWLSGSSDEQLIAGVMLFGAKEGRGRRRIKKIPTSVPLGVAAKQRIKAREERKLHREN